MSITDKKCVPCTAMTVPLAQETIEALLLLIPDWKFNNSFFGGSKYLVRDFRFKDFKAAIEFINKVAALSESENHHPDIILRRYNRVILELTTHAINNLSDNDFIMAAKIDQLI